MIISLGGKSCTGKTTVGKNLAERLDYKFISVGNLYRQYGGTDQQLDHYLARIIRSQDNLVIEGRMANYLLKRMGTTKDLAIKLIADEQTQVKRYLLRHPESTLEEAITQTISRDLNDYVRLRNTYNISIFNGAYDHIINTEDIATETIVRIIEEHKKVKTRWQKQECYKKK